MARRTPNRIAIRARDRSDQRSASYDNISVVERCRRLAEPVAAELGLEIFDVCLVREGGRLLLRYTIDCDSGITHQHCEQFSRRIDPLLDEVDPIPVAYFLEVSSPGAERPLRNEAEFQRFIGHYIHVEALDTGFKEDGTESSAAGKSDEIKSQTIRTTVREGLLQAVHDEGITIRLGADRDCFIPLQSIKSAHLMLKPKPEQNHNPKRRTRGERRRR